MSEEEKVEEEVKPKRRMFRRAENGSDWVAKEDVRTFMSWEKEKITTVMAAKRIARNNEWEELTTDEFIELAHCLGYWRKGEI